MLSEEKPPVDFSDLQPGVSEDEKRAGAARIVQVVLGIFLVIAGIILMPLPGPGVAIVLVGLILIKPDNFLVQWIRRRVPGIPEEGPIPKRYFVFGGVVLVASSTFSALYGDDVLGWVKDQL